MSTILVTGASGFVGSWTIPALLADGHRIIALVHSPAAADTVRDRLPAVWRERVDVRIGDITKPDTLPAALVGADVVIHLAAIPNDRSGGAELRLVNTEGTRAVVEAMKTAGIRRLIHLGAMGVADDPNLHYASSKAKAEALVAASGLDWTILKPSLQFGPGDGFFNIVADLARISPGVIPVPGTGRSRFQPIHVGDVARVVVQTVGDAATIHGSFDLGGPRYWTYREITAEVLAAMGKRRVIVPMPVPLISLVAGVSEFLHLPFPVATDQLRQLKLDNIAALDVIPTRFGFEPRAMEGQLGYLRSKPKEQRIRGEALPGPIPT